MAKKHKLGEVSFTLEGYEKLTAMSRKDQISYLSDRLSPKDPIRAEKLLKGVPNGDGNGANKQVGKSEAATGNGNGKDNPTKPATTQS